MKAFIIAVWLVVVCCGLVALGKYQAQPGAKGRSPNEWPRDSEILPARNVYNLVISLHPHCPCSSATVEELGAILAHTHNSMHVQILMFSPEGEKVEWTKSPLSDAVARLPHTTIRVDGGGKEAARFGSLTSGAAQLFAPDGRLVFHGGITASRGHAGENAGADSIIKYANGENCRLAETAVYGCSIRRHEHEEAAK